MADYCGMVKVKDTTICVDNHFSIDSSSIFHIFKEEITANEDDKGQQIKVLVMLKSEKVKRVGLVFQLKGKVDLLFILNVDVLQGNNKEELLFIEKVIVGYILTTAKGQI